MQTTEGYFTQMKTITQLKQAMKAPMYRELTERELIIYKTGFKNGFRMSLQQNKAKIEGELFKLKLKQDYYNYYDKYNNSYNRLKIFIINSLSRKSKRQYC